MEVSINDLMKTLREKEEKIKAGGGEKKIKTQHEKGKLTARERIGFLLDKDSFVEQDLLVEHRCINFDMDKVEAPGEGVVTGYGTIDGRLAYVFAQDFTVIGGSLGEMHAKKICKIMDMAMKMGAPCIGINDSGGARIQEGVDSLSGYGQIFYRNTMASGVIPQISIIAGPAAGGAVYSPAIMDFVFMVKNIGIMHITGPEVIKAVTGEVVSSEQLGGAMTHNIKSGVAHFAAENEEEVYQMVRKLISFIPSNNLENSPIVESKDDPNRMEETLLNIVPVDPNKPYEMKDVIRCPGFKMWLQVDTLEPPYCGGRSHYRDHASPCDALEYPNHGKSSGTQRSNDTSDMEATQPEAASGQNLQTQPRQARCTTSLDCI